MSYRIEDSVFGQFVYDGSAEQALSRLKQYLDTEADIDYRVRDDTEITLSTQPRPLSVRVRSSLPIPDVDAGLHLSLGIEQFQGENAREYYEMLLETMTLIYEATEPAYAYGILRAAIEWSDMYLKSPTTSEALAKNRIVCPRWLMLFTPEMVDEYGREWLLDLPADRFDELHDGGLLVVSTERLVTDPEDIGGFSDDMAEMDRAFGLDPTETGNELNI